MLDPCKSLHPSNIKFMFWQTWQLILIALWALPPMPDTFWGPMTCATYNCVHCMFSNLIIDPRMPWSKSLASTYCLSPTILVEDHGFFRSRLSKPLGISFQAQKGIMDPNTINVRRSMLNSVFILSLIDLLSWHSPFLSTDHIYSARETCHSVTFVLPPRILSCPPDGVIGRLMEEVVLLRTSFCTPVMQSHPFVVGSLPQMAQPRVLISSYRRSVLK
jgi:hypothetical protein